MQGRLRKNIGFTLIFFAFFFLFEPSYALVDPLPDFIGYTILCIALMNLADINDKIKRAQISFRNGIILSVLRTISLVIVNKTAEEGEQSIGQLLFVFVFALCELIILIPGYKALFEGLLTLGTFEGGEAVHLKKRDNAKNASEKAFSFTVSFLILKNIVCALPEFTSLHANSGYEFANILRIFAIIIVAPVGLYWLLNTLVYFKRVEKDAPFIEALTQKYIDKAAGSPDFFKNRAYTWSHYAVLGALLLSFDLYLEKLNVIPDFLFYGAVIILVVLLRKHVRYAGAIVALSTLGVLWSISIHIIEKEFYSRFYIEAIIKNFDAYNHFNLLVCVYAVESIVFIALLFFILRALYKNFAEMIFEKHSNTDSYYIEHCKSLKSRAIVCFIIGIFNTVATMYRVLSLPYYSKSWVFYYSGVISGIVDIAFVSSACMLIWYIIGEIKYNYKSYL